MEKNEGKRNTKARTRTISNNIINQRCIALTKSGKKCRANALKNERFCLFHSDSEAAKQAREKRNPKRILSNQELIIILQHELRKVKRSKNDELRSGEVRRIIELIHMLKTGEKPSLNDEKKSLTFEQRVEKAQQRKQNESS